MENVFTEMFTRVGGLGTWRCGYYCGCGYRSEGVATYDWVVVVIQNEPRRVDTRLNTLRGFYERQLQPTLNAGRCFVKNLSLGNQSVDSPGTRLHRVEVRYNWRRE